LIEFTLKKLAGNGIDLLHIEPMVETASNAIDWPLMLETHRPWLTRVLRCRIGDDHAVDDALQEIALAVVRQTAPLGGNGQPERCSTTNRLPGEINGNTTSLSNHAGIPNDPEKVAPWLYRIAVRQAVNYHRKSNRKSNAKPTPEIEVTCESQQPLDWLLAEEEQKSFDNALSQLSPAQREILTLKYAEKWSYQQLAEHLGIPVRSVEYRLLQARTELRKYLTRSIV
jgi:RNA polymerase sigma-70 factor (ECF subfamily)